MDLANKTELISFLKSHGLWAKHGLGQNFLVDREALDKIVEAAELKPHPTSPYKGEECQGDLVIEIGPGLGVLTERLIEKAGKVVAVEIDGKLAELLNCHIAELLTPPTPPLQKGRKGEDGNTTTCLPARQVKQYNNFELINADILKLNIPALIGGREYKVVANIPYYITSKIIELFLTQERKPESIVLLVQKEVAERICAKPGQMSILALSVQLYGEPEIIGIVPKESFFPSPEVDSAILKINNIHPFSYHPQTPPTLGGETAEKEFFRLIHIGFASKRKTLVNNLSAGLHIDKQQASGIIKSIGLNENVRAQELSLEEWGKLTKLMPKS